MTGVSILGGANRSVSFASVRSVLLALYFMALGVALTTPVTDPDFWWHLASGRWMWERGELLHADPFAFTSAAFPSVVAGSFAFTQYWLAELLMHGINAAAGLEGAILLRAAVFTLLFFFLYRLLRGVGAGMLAAVLLLALANRAIVHELGYIGDRPQMWSSLFFVATLLLCQHQREGRRVALVALPLLMLLWSNMHGGYLLGLAVVGLGALAAGVAGQATWGLRTSAIATVLMSGCNPGGFSALLSYPSFRVSGAGILHGIVEESSLLNWINPSSSLRLVPALTAILAISLLTLIPRVRNVARERPDLLALYLLTLVAGLSSARFLIFFVIVATVMTASNTAALLHYRRALFPGLVTSSAAPAVHTAAIALVLVALTAHQAGVAARMSAFRPGTVVRHPYEGVADFLERSGLTGNLFNEYGAGGYFTWRLFPSLKVFIYGRLVSSELLGLYEDLLLRPSTSIRGGPRYQRELDALEVDALVLPSCNATSGLMLPLTVLVARDENWALVYSDATAVVLARKSKAPAGLLADVLPPTALYDNMIAIARKTGRTGHGQAMSAWRYSLAFALYAKGERAAALAVLDDYLRFAPGHAAAVRIRERIVREIESGAVSPQPATEGQDRF